MADEQVSITVDEKEKAAVLATLHEMEYRIAHPQPLLTAIGQYMISSINKNFTQGGRPAKWKPISPITQLLRRGKGGGKPLMDTGMLRKSITAQVGKDQFTIAPTVVYGAIHQLGGTIHPKKAKYLAIPLSREAKERGSPRNVQGLFAIFGGILGGRGEGMLVRSQEKKGKMGVIPWYLLKKSVTIPARPFMMFQTEDTDRIVSMAERYILKEQKGEI